MKFRPIEEFDYAYREDVLLYDIVEDCLWVDYWYTFNNYGQSISDWHEAGDLYPTHFCIIEKPKVNHG